MRDIVCKGKRKDGKGWVRGYCVMLGDSCYIYTGKANDIIGTTKNGVEIADFERYAVDPVTVSQFTGMTDVDGKEIYEHDIVTFHRGGSRSYTGEVEYIDSCAGYFITRSSANDNEMCMFTNYKVVGNLYDNPTLLNE